MNGVQVRRYLVGLSVGAAVLVGLPALATSTVAPRAQAAVTAADLCTPGSDEEACEVALEPTPLPQRKVVGENEVGVLSRSPIEPSEQPVSGVGELSAGGIAGSCDPATEFCSLGRSVDLGDPAGDAPAPPVAIGDNRFGSPEGDAALTAADLDGDGRQELVRASACRPSSGPLELCLSYLTPGAAPGDPRYSSELETGLNVDASGSGRMRVVAGPLGLAAADVTSASFRVDAAQESTVATFTTAERHTFQVGDPVRLGNDASLQAALCVDSPLARDGAQCIGEDLLSYHPVTAATATTFSVDLGVLVVVKRGVGQVVTPPPWSAGCDACGVRAEALSTGVAVAWTAPTGSLRLAVFSLVSQAGGRTFRLLDARPVGTLLDSPAGFPDREPFDLVVDDFRSGGPDEIAVAWGGDCGTGLPCPRVSFLAMDDAKRLDLLSSGSFRSSSWCAAPGAEVDPGAWGLYSVSLASGRFQTPSSSNRAAGSDLAIGWVAHSGVGDPHVSYHAFQAFDVDAQLVLEPVRPLDPGDPAADPSACATVTARRSTDGIWAMRSGMQIAAADLDGATGDELVVAETLPAAPTGPLPAPDAPVSVSVWSQRSGDGPGLGWRAQSRMQRADRVESAWTQPFAPAIAVPQPTKGYLAVGDEGSGQVSLALGRLARREAESTDTLAYPNAINPDVVVGWTCDGTQTCGRPTADISGVAVDAIGVSVDGDGAPRLLRAGGADADVMSERQATTPTSKEGAAPERLSRTYVQVVTADLNGDSATLGDPLRSYAVGELQPLMVLRAPPVQFAAIDGSHPGYDKDGQISSAEVYDLSGCYAGNGQNTDTGDCDMRTTYTTDGSSEQSFSITTQNSWGIDAAVKAGISSGQHKAGGDCDSVVCWEATLELAYAHSEEQQTEAQRAKSFSYSTEQAVAPMQDRAFVATSDIQMSQVPIYYGTFTGSLPPEPDVWTFSATPLDTVYSWVSTRDPQYGSIFAGPTPGNVLSYPASAARVPTARTPVLSVRRETSTRLAVVTASNHGFLCALQANQVATAFPSSTGSPCAGQQEPVRLQGAGAFDGTDYVVSTIRTPTQLVLQKIGSQLPVAADPCAAGGCTLRRQPSALPVQTQEIGPGTSGNATFRFADVQGYSDRYAVSNGGSAEAATSGEAGDFVWEAHVKGEFEHSDESMMGLVLESATSWTFDYAGASRPGSYRITPYLADDPRTGALTLTWTAAPVGASGLWGNPEYGYGGVGDPDIPPRPDPGFALPQLWEPYRVHTGLDDGLDVLLSSPDFATTECDEAGVCRPRAAVAPGRELALRAVVHNYALTDLAAGVVVRFYLGDPARGGYPIAEERINDPIPPRGDVEVTATWTPPPGFAGQPGQPIYAVIDPGNQVDEVFDWTAPVVLWDRTLRGTVLSARTRIVDGERVAVYRTDVDHGVEEGHRVRVGKMADYNRRGVTLAVTPTSFTVPIGKKLPPLVKEGAWASPQNESCATNNPWYGNATKDFYSFGGPQEFQSRCPTTNNEGFFLTPAFAGNRGAVTRSDLSVDAGDISFTKDRKGVRVAVTSAARILDERVQVQVWVCATAGPCTPVDAGRAQTNAVTSTISTPAGGTKQVTVPFTRTVFGAGDYRIAAQVIPLTTWERPPGTGITDVSMGQYADNQTTARVVIR